MILVINNKASIKDIEQLRDRLHFMGLQTALSKEANHHSIAIINGADEHTKPDLFAALPFVDKVLPFNQKYKLVGKDVHQQPTVIKIKDYQIGADHFTVMAGPCSIESRDQLMGIAQAVSERGATILRGGAFKPRTSPYDFQGLGEEGLVYMRDSALAHGLLSITEVMAVEDVPLVAKYVDILQIGARNMQNFNLLKAVGKVDNPVLLKRGPSATYNEFLLAAEYVLSMGNPNVMLCERGIRTFETYSRNTLDIAAVPILRELTHLPIIIDPSHGTGLRNIVAPMAAAALAVKANGVIVEVHTDPDNSLSDAQQTISPDMFADMMANLKKIGGALDIKV